MSTTDELVEANRRYAARFTQADLAVRPTRGVAVVACMDARLDVHGLLGLNLGEAHVIRNAGGAVTDDVVRSLMISQRLLGTEEIVLVHHTDCGMTSFREDDLKAAIEADTGIRPPFALEAFPDVVEDVRQSMARITASPFLPSTRVRGFVYDVRTGALEEVGA